VSERPRPRPAPLPPSAEGFPPPRLETPRLRLRLPTLRDAAAIFHGYASDAEVTRYLAWRPHRTVQDTREFLVLCETAWETGVGHRPWVIERRDDGAILGMIGVDVGPRGVNVGYVLGRLHWGQGYMAEALLAVCDAALADVTVHRVSAFCDVDNRASARVMEKAGMHHEGTLRRYMRHVNVSPEPRDCHIYSRIR
jgi:[ribosomal protein S5]-alanine N-acetyltransferase